MMLLAIKAKEAKIYWTHDIKYKSMETGRLPHILCCSNQSLLEMVSGAKASSSSSKNNSSPCIILKMHQVIVKVKKHSTNHLHYPGMPEILTVPWELSRDA